MHCKVCGSDQLIETEYETGSLRAPALECVKCHALNLDERAAKSERDLDSVRRAVAARQSAGMPYDSGTHRTDAGAVAAAIVESVVSHVDVVLARVRVALEFCSQMTDGEVGKAVADARGGIQEIEALMDDLGRRCDRATRREAEGSAEARTKKANG